MIGAFLPPQYPGAALTRALLGIDYKRYTSPQAAKHSLSSTLYHLKKDGLVASTGSRKKTIWSITKKGRLFLKDHSFQEIKHPYILAPEDGITRLLTFDIPEQEQRSRRWLRTELLSIGFRPLQKSVYIGKRPLPKDFIDNIDDLHLGRYIHIVSIEKQGTLRKK